LPHVLVLQNLCMQSTCALCKASQNNTMMTRFFGDEMTLKTILLMCDPIVTSNALECFSFMCYRSQGEIPIVDDFNWHWFVLFHQSQLMLLDQLFVDEKCICIEINKCFVSISMNLFHLIMIGRSKNMVLGPRINWDHFRHMTHH
jgi:hypothetical protein